MLTKHAHRIDFHAWEHFVTHRMKRFQVSPSNNSVIAALLSSGKSSKLKMLFKTVAGHHIVEQFSSLQTRQNQLLHTPRISAPRLPRTLLTRAAIMEAPATSASRTQVSFCQLPLPISRERHAAFSFTNMENHYQANDIAPCRSHMAEYSTSQQALLCFLCQCWRRHRPIC